MTHPDPAVEEDRRISANLTSKLANKTIAKVTMIDAYEGKHGTACNGRMTFEFTDGTYFVLDEGSQEGSMEYEVLPTAKVFFDAVKVEQAMNAVIDHVINETLTTANISIMNDEDVVAYLNSKYDSAAAYRKTPPAESLADAIRYTNAVNRLRDKDEAIADTISFMQGIKRGRETLKKFYE